MGYHLYVESKIWHKWTYLWNRITDIENRLVVAKGKGVGEGMEWEVEVSRYKLLYIEWRKNKVLLYSTENYIQYPMINYNGKEYLKKECTGLPWWRSGWESACQCGGRGFGPWSGRIPHATERLSPWATIAEPARLEPVLRYGRGRDGERPAHRDEEWPPLAATGGSPRTETKTQHSQKIN